MIFVFGVTGYWNGNVVGYSMILLAYLVATHMITNKVTG